MQVQLDPPWDQTKMSDAARLQLGLMWKLHHAGGIRPALPAAAGPRAGGGEPHHRRAEPDGGHLVAQRGQDDAGAAQARPGAEHAGQGRRLHAGPARGADQRRARRWPPWAGGSSTPRFCERHSGSTGLCANMADCSIRSVWRLLQDAIDDVLGRMTLKDLLRSESDMRAWPAGAGRRACRLGTDRRYGPTSPRRACHPDYPMAPTSPRSAPRLLPDGGAQLPRVGAPAPARGRRPRGRRRARPLEAEGDGYFSGVVPAARAGSLYRFRLDGGDAFPDPASRFQPEGPHGPSQVVDPGAYRVDGRRLAGPLAPRPGPLRDARRHVHAARARGRRRARELPRAGASSASPCSR